VIKEGEVVRRRTLCIVDDQFYANVATDTSAELNEILGRADQLSLHAVVTDVVSAGASNVTLDLFLFGSADGQNWVQRNNNATTAGNGDISLSWAPSATVGSGQKMWSDFAAPRGVNTNATGPLMPFLRVHVLVLFGSLALKLYATLRDQG
jgi:hypothetical protein